MLTAHKIIIAITGLVSLLPLLGLSFAGRVAERKHLLKSGARTTGRVISIDRIGESTKSALVLRYQFLVNGRETPVEGHCAVNMFAPYKPGDEAIICYNTKHPSSSVILSPKGRPL